MVDYQFSKHASEMLRERNLREEWVSHVIEQPEAAQAREDGTVHYVRAIEEAGERYLRVVVNPNVSPQRIVTVFFDRSLRKL